MTILRSPRLTTLYKKTHEEEYRIGNEVGRTTTVKHRADMTELRSSYDWSKFKQLTVFKISVDLYNFKINIKIALHNLWFYYISSMSLNGMNKIIFYGLVNNWVMHGWRRYFCHLGSTRYVPGTIYAPERFCTKYQWYK